MCVQQFKILLVEHKPTWKGNDEGDDGVFQEWIEEALREHKQGDSPCYILTKIETFEEAKRTLSQNNLDYHLLITDLSLGQTDNQGKNSFIGTNLLDKAHQKKIPAIAVSSLGINGNQMSKLFTNYHFQKFIDESDYLNKSEFVAEIQEIWREWSAHQSGNVRETPPPTIPKTIPIPPMFKALLIGIAEYSQVRKLTKTTNDVYGLRQALVNNGYSKGYIDCLVNEKATKEEILKRLDTLVASGENDTVMVFFSGHGMSYFSEDYLCPVDADLNRIQETCISSDEFTTALRKIQAGRLVVFLDSCHSGGVGQARDATLNLQEGLSQKTYDQIAQRENGKGRVIIASCLPNEVSWELADCTNGLFTHYLLKGLNGEAADSDGKVRIMRLSGYISRNVPNHGREQHPFIQLAAQDFVVAINPNSQQNPTVTEPKPTGAEQQQLRQQIFEAEVYEKGFFKLLCADMNVADADIDDDNFRVKINNLIGKCIKKKLYNELIDAVHQHPSFTNQNA
jgi:hypothetical protein